MATNIKHLYEVIIANELYYTFYSLSLLIVYDKIEKWLRLTKALALTCGTVHIDLGTDDVAERHEHLGELGITELLWQVVDEQVTTFRS